MTRPPVISVAGVSKSFRMEALRPKTLKEAFAILRRQREVTHYQALQGVSFEVYPGETVGVIGTNGSGKSTMLKLITGIMKPSAGQVQVHGRVSPLIELGAGFHPDFSGRENVYLNAAILGVSRAEVDAKFNDIAAFAEIGQFIEQPVKTYSSGMYMRLAFSIAIHVDPDILVVDEVLAVGDDAFQVKCLDRIRAFRQAGKTILIVAHNQKMMAEICDRVIWLDKGVVRMAGPAQAVLTAYSESLFLRRNKSEGASVDVMAPVSVSNVQVLGSGHAFEVCFDWRAIESVEASWRLLVCRAIDGLPIVSDQTLWQAISAGEAGTGTFQWNAYGLAEGEYLVSLDAIAKDRPIPPYAKGLPVRVASEWIGAALWRADGQWSIRSAEHPSPASQDA